MSYWSFLLQCLAFFLLQAAGSARQALSQLQYRGSSDSTITALHGLLGALFLPQLGSISPCTCVSRGGRQLFPAWHPQRQLSTADTERRRHQVLFIIKCREKLNRRIDVSPRAVWPPTNSEGWVCFDTFPALRSSCNLPKQGETNVPLLYISLLLPYPPFMFFVAPGSKKKP